ncbi:cystathionine beta-lyase [Raphidocelis subcapitata]|uniref:cysteine-S-conjugate beta-lyase n=1 Tax=Raphidocelis subcapitata TaxID=307507 RepID=A0A2V0NM78_9CHLO|nr:cystathionine beta-lyase [Raphidocelis subcapitata]|eukprot:GBF88229.1 cystathionine beta-lyase [Raphidocelis subcapitata]
MQSALARAQAVQCSAGIATRPALPGLGRPRRAGGLAAPAAPQQAPRGPALACGAPRSGPGIRGSRLRPSATANGAPDASETVYIPVSELRSLVAQSLAALGYNSDEIATLSEVLLYAQLRGNNQGVIKITTGGMNRTPTAGRMRVERDTKLSALLDGAGEAGMLVLSRATEMAAEKARSHGFGIVGTHGTSTSTGALGYYAEKIAASGLIGIVLAQSPEFVAPHGAKKAVFGTNPIAVAVPSGGAPVVMDMATAAYAWFGVLEAKTAGRKIPLGVAQDSEGDVTEDPARVLEGGAIRVFDGSHKGSNLALMVELLAGPLVGAATADKLAAKNWGNLVIALDPELLGDREEIRARMQVVLDRVKSAPRLPGVDEILLPGERGSRLAASRLASGTVPVEANLYRNLKVAASKAATAPPPAANGAPPAAAANGAPAPPARATKRSTQLLHPPPGSVTDPYGASGPPLYQTATFAQPGATEFGPYDYTRSGNPTRTLLEEQWAALEGADRAFAFTSGMAAIAACCRLVAAGEHILAGDDIYGGTSRLLSQVVPNCGVEVSNVDMADMSAVRAGIIPGKTKLVIVESPTNPRRQVCDIAAIVEAAHAAGALVMVDNSFMTPLFQRPLDLGADISMTSGTKYIGGHGDVTLGVLAVRGAELAKRVYFLQNAEGAGLAPMDCWLALRGLKTMSLRLERAAATAARLAAWLSRHPLVKRVNYASLPAHPGSELHASQAASGGAVLSFTTGDVEVSKAIVDAATLFKVTVSFGNVVSLISLPCYMSHASIPAEVRAARGLPDDLVRIACGLEDADDLIWDLEQAMTKAAKLAKPPLPMNGGAAGGDGGGAASAREAALLARIAALEARLDAAQAAQQQQQQHQQQQAAGR